ncbi:phosphoribosylaminoimidazolecarboxamide formyltransferase [Pseudoflavonifractor sp. MSJ-37]|uniref:phosphoribosylaminoimidazolecarboxamide formyltransferase n=1 Tax=Pseudoflavonifractor sp. MSJ-37 TaxID=2841531 RepID=UPI0035301F9B
MVQPERGQQGLSLRPLYRSGHRRGRYRDHQQASVRSEVQNTMNQLELKYGCNPNQKPARIFMEEGELPLKVLNGRPGYINFMDALNSWQLVKALKKATGLPAAASFKHVSPAGAALGLPLTDVERHIYFAPEGSLSPLACAYIRARGADRLCSFGDWAALSDVCDADTARFLSCEVSDGVIAPGYTDEALDILKAKRKGGYNVVEIDPNYVPAPVERRNIFGITFEQGYNALSIDESLLGNVVTANKDLPQQAKHDMLLALITLKYTQSNSVCYVKNGMTIGVGAGQQSRIHCTRLAGNKADIWWLRQHPKVLALQFVDGIRRPDRDNAIDLYISDEHEDVLADGVWQNIFREKPEVLTSEEKKEWVAHLSDVTVGSDAFFPFGDNVERAHRSGVRYIVQPGGSIRDDQVIATADKHGMVMAFTGIRLFHH